MLVQVGPLPSGSVTAWIAYARTILDRVGRGDLGATTLAPDVRLGFERFLDDWEAAAGGDVFMWTAEVDREQVEFLAHTWFGLAAALADEATDRGFPLAPDEGEPFYRALVAGLLDALDQEEGPGREFGEQLRQSWPGFKDP